MKQLSKEYLQELIDNAPGLKADLIADGMSEESYGEMLDFLEVLTGKIKD